MGELQTHISGNLGNMVPKFGQLASCDEVKIVDPDMYICNYETLDIDITFIYKTTKIPISSLQIGFHFLMLGRSKTGKPN